MTKDQNSQLLSLIHRYREAAEEFGIAQCGSSIHFNRAYFKVEALQTEVREFIDGLEKS